MSSSRILLVDDDSSLCRITQFQLEEAGYKVLTAQCGEDGIALYKQHEPEVVVTDLKMPGIDGLELLAEIKRLDAHALVVVVTAHGSIDTAIHAMKRGAHDYLCKPFEKDALLATIEKALRFQGLIRENAHLQDELLQHYRFDNIVGGSAVMDKVFQIVRRVSRTDSTVLLQGESGTGKELIARAIHYSSPRQKKPFVPVNCPAIPEQLMESELFGHVRGAFTGAHGDRAGKFELADGGTLFLDEIADMRLDLQGKLLRILQEKELERVGGQKLQRIDVRVVAATNKDLHRLVEEQKFRADLYYRLSVVPLKLPPLRERRDDVPLLVQHFLREHGAEQIVVEPDLYRVLEAYHWPGNVRELQNAIEQALVLRHNDERIGAQDLPEHIRHAETSSEAFPIELPSTGLKLEEVEKRLIQLALQRAEGNQTQAAQLLGISRQTLIYRLEKYDLKTASGQPPTQSR